MLFSEMTCYTKDFVLPHSIDEADSFLLWQLVCPFVWDTPDKEMRFSVSCF